MGRPAELTVREMTDFAPDVLQKLDQAFMDGMNIQQAIFLANISSALYYQVVTKNPALVERFDKLKENQKIKAKNNVKKFIEKGDVDTSKWYLERRAKDEFAPKSELEHSGELKIEVVRFDADSQNPV